MVNAAAHEDAEVGAVMQAGDTAAMANQRAQKIAAVERKASYVDLLGHNIELSAKVSTSIAEEKRFGWNLALLGVYRGAKQRLPAVGLKSEIRQERHGMFDAADRQ